jgi:hypothetical protein
MSLTRAQGAAYTAQAWGQVDRSAGGEHEQDFEEEAHAMRIPAWFGSYEAAAYPNPPGSPMPAHVLMEGLHGGFTIAEVESMENAKVIADALNLYAQVAAMVQEQEREDAAPRTE